MPFCRVCGNFSIMTLDFQKFCDQCTIRYFRNELHEGEIRQTSLNMERSLRLPLFYFLHAFDISPLSVPQNFLFSITQPFERQTERQNPINDTEGSLSRNTVQGYAHTSPSYRQSTTIRPNLLTTHLFSTLGLILALLGLFLIFIPFTPLILITLIIESTALIVALISNRIEVRSWRQKLTIALIIIYWIVVIFMLIVYFNGLIQAGALSI